MLSATKFIPPCLPTLRREPPDGETWLHEVKFDGWRLQLHKIGDRVKLYSKGGHDFTDRFPAIAAALLFFPAKSAILDAELAACDSEGMPDFNALIRGDPSYLCVWAFDLLVINSKDLRPIPCIERKERLSALVEKCGNDHIRYSCHFDEPHVLLKTCAKMKLEGVVSKRANSQYRSGASKDWIKVKCPAWREENTWRHDFFAKQK